MYSFFTAARRVGGTGLLALLVGCQTIDATVRVRWARDPESLAPFSAPNQNAIDALNLITSSLLLPEVTTQTIAPFLVEQLATVTHRGDSLTVLTYRLREQARWDNGEPVLATDVAFTCKLLHNPYLPIDKERHLLNFITAVELDARDPRRFSLVCRGLANRNYELSAGDLVIMAEAGLDPDKSLRPYSLAALRSPSKSAQAAQAQIGKRYQQADLAHHPNNLPSCGPYKLADWQAERELRFTKCDDWWGDDIVSGRNVRFKANPQEIRYLIIPDEDRAAEALHKGELDVYPQLSLKLFSKMRHNPNIARDLSFYLEPSYDVIFAGFNTKRPALADPGTRRALAYLFNPSLLNGASDSGNEWLTVGFISPADRQHYNDSLPLIPYNPIRAMQGLLAAGWKHGNGSVGWTRKGQHLRFTLMYRVGETSHEQAAKQFAEAAAELGIPVTVRPTGAVRMHQELAAGNFDLFVKTMKGNPFGFDFTPVLSTQGIGQGNWTRFGTPSSDRLVHELATASDPQVQKRLLRRFQAVIREQMPIVPLFVPMNRVAANRRLNGLHVNSLKPGYSIVASEWKSE